MLDRDRGSHALERPARGSVEQGKATVTAITQATVWRIPGADFLSSLEAAGAPSDALVEGIADRLARMEEGSGL